MSAVSLSPLPTRPSSPQAIDPRDITSPDQIAAQLAILARKESDLTLSLNALIADRSHIDGAVHKLREVGGQIDRLSAEVDGRPVSGALGLTSRGLGVQNGDYAESSTSRGGGRGAESVGVMSEGLVERVQKVWETSERVGGKVRRLDEEISRVREATEIVTEVLELKNALQTLASAMGKQDWELASRSCRRAMSVRKEVLQGGFAGVVVPSPEQPDPPAQQLTDLRAELLEVFRREFDAAAAKKDEQGVSRFFRLWPGIEAEEEGLSAYGDFVVGLVKARSSAAGKPSSAMYYLTQLTSLLESIAHIIDQHQPVVDKYYGAGRMKIVVGRLIGESDRVVRGLVEGWEEERRVGRLISDTKLSKFTLLSSPSLFPPLFPSLSGGPNAQISLGSIATATTSHLPNLTSASSLLQSYAPGGKKPERTTTPIQVEEEPQGPDPRDVDRVLGELVALGGRWALFRRFVFGRVTVGLLHIIEGHAKKQEEPPEEINGTSTAPRTNGEKPIVDSSAGDANGSEEESPEANSAPAHEDLDILDESGSQRAIENLLKVYYEPLEMWFLRMSIEKAQRLDSPETSSRPHLSSILDDTFYLLKLVLSRVLNCGSLSTLRSMRVRIMEIIERDYIGVIRKKMEAVYASAGQSSVAERERIRDQRNAFIIYLNDLDISGDYTDRLLDEFNHNMPQTFIPSQLDAVKQQLSLLGDLATIFRSSSKTGLEQLFNQLTRPRLRAVLDDCYKDLNYLLDEDSFAEADEADLIRKRFIRAWEGLMEGYKDAFTDHNYQTFFNLTVETLVRPWEKVVMSMRFTELGAIRYDRDIRGIANYLSTQTSFGGVRDKFARLQQIGTVLNMDQEEDPEDFYSNSGIPWRLSKAEYNGVLEQRV